MNKLAFVFPGQGAQAVGMGKDLFDQYDVAKRLFAEADEALGYSIKDMCFEGPADDLKLTANTQPAILTVSVIVNEILKEHGVQPDVAGGHSLGEYSALVAAGVLSFKDAVALVHKRGQYMQEAVPVGEGGMAAIIGLDDETIAVACEKATKEAGEVQPVNFNCPGQTRPRAPRSSLKTLPAWTRPSRSSRQLVPRRPSFCPSLRRSTRRS